MVLVINSREKYPKLNLPRNILLEPCRTITQMHKRKHTP